MTLRGARKLGELRDVDTGETLVQFMVPAADTDALSCALRVLTHQLTLRTPEASDPLGGVFGGAFGYGVCFENDVFLMHPYCWCEKPDCPWCAGCWCWENCRSRYGRGVPIGSEPYPQGEKCPWCREVNQWPEKGSLGPTVAPHYGAPHFWHKPSGLRVWWYKYIGRDNNIHVESDVTVDAVLDDCLRSITGQSIEDAIVAYAQAEKDAADATRKAMEFWLSDEGRAVMQKMEDDGVIKTFTFDGLGNDSEE